MYGGGVECLAKMGELLKLELEHGVCGVVLLRRRIIDTRSITRMGSSGRDIVEGEAITSPQIINELTKLITVARSYRTLRAVLLRTSHLCVSISSRTRRS